MDSRANSKLQHSEKSQKLYLKRLLKVQHTLYKYGMRYQQAIRRRDMNVAIPTLQLIISIEETLRHRYNTPSTMKYYTSTVHDPFVTQNYIHRNSIAGTIREGATTTTAIDFSTIDIMPRKSHAERTFIERFYQQLQQQLVLLSSASTKQSPHTSPNHDQAALPRILQETLRNGDSCNTDTEDAEWDMIHDTSNVPSETNGNQCKKTTSGDRSNNNSNNNNNTYDVARELLRHMTKGTQQLVQFQNLDALLGYTRHKFVERAMLVVSSLNQILQSPVRTTESDPVMNCLDVQNCHNLWKERLLSIRTVTSIGCGPGCDAVGVVAVLSSLVTKSKQHNNCCSNNSNNVAEESNRELYHNAETDYVLDRVVLLDWAMEQWYHPIVHCVEQLLLEKQHVRSIVSATCDVRYSVNHQSSFSRSANATSTTSTEQHRTNIEQKWDNKSDDHWLSDTDLVVISYLFSETREKWYTYLDELIHDYCKVGTLFLISDPTAWQLHIFRQRYEYSTLDLKPLDLKPNNSNNNQSTFGNGCCAYDDEALTESTFTDASSTNTAPAIRQPDQRVLMEFQWLDSSMYRPELQELEGRNGPGVLLAIKIAN
jgi:hypothetical protein